MTKAMHGRSPTIVRYCKGHTHDHDTTVAFHHFLYQQSQFAINVAIREGVVGLATHHWHTVCLLHIVIIVVVDDKVDRAKVLRLEEGECLCQSTRLIIKERIFSKFVLRNSLIDIGREQWRW